MDGRVDAAVEPRTVDEAKDAVERSRQRISSTLDELEGRIVEKKQAIEDRVDVLRPVREQVTLRPFTAVAVAVGVGALLGSLGGDDAAEPTRKRPRLRIDAADRAELREWRRARRDRLRSRDQKPERASRLGPLKDQLAGALTAAIGAAVTARLREFTENRGGGGDRLR